MSCKITREVLESYLHCKTKGYLKLAGERGVRSAREEMLLSSRSEAQRQMLHRYQDARPLADLPLTANILKQGNLFIAGPTLETDQLSLVFDGLLQADGSSLLGSYHYVPVMCSKVGHPRKPERQLLAVYGLMLSQLQGRMPSYGLVWHGREGAQRRVKLSADQREPDHLLRDIAEISKEGSPQPLLFLNDHCSECEFQHQCRTQALQEDNISLLRGVSEKEVRKYSRKGVLTLTQLAHTFRPRRKRKDARRQGNQRQHALHALAIRDTKIYVLGTPQCPAGSAKIYLDLEGLPEERFVYLLGMIVDTDGVQTTHSLWANDKGQEREVFDSFLEEAAKHQDLRIFCYGGYERAFIKRMRPLVRKKCLVDRVLDSTVNILSLIYSHFYFPVYSNGLKDIGGHLGYSWTEPDASGIQSIVWRKRWEATRDDAWKQKLLTYNLEDCAALKGVAEFISHIGSAGVPVTELPCGAEVASQVAWVKDLDRLAADRKMGRGSFLHADYEYINKCAYFDYQRERVYARMRGIRRRPKVGQKKHRNRRLRVAKYLEFTASRCPSCRSMALLGKDTTGGKCSRSRSKRVLDLVLSPSGIRRRIIECRTHTHRCLACGHAFIPERYARLDKHSHGLKSWAMYQHIAYGFSFTTLQKMLRDFFRLHVSTAEVAMFKTLMAHYYKLGYQRLLKSILAGNLLHADETEVVLRTGKAYVWVFTNLDEVIFMYRPTREGGFLQNLLKGFRGVLVSDFYAAYDSLERRQQKCLIHLIRDMNQDLLSNPYDEELRSITRPFGAMLRSIVTTVDAHGLKRTHLQRHKREIETFFEQLWASYLHSEPAKALRERLRKYHGKLFTFTEQDGVPWNNNNAENAIRQFAYYREDTVGVMTETGLTNYLILLSIYCTCKYKGLNFLEFLLSRERTVESDGRTKSGRRSPTDIYPKGFRIPFDSLNQDKAQQHDGAGAMR